MCTVRHVSNVGNHALSTTWYDVRMNVQVRSRTLLLCPCAHTSMLPDDVGAVKEEYSTQAMQCITSMLPDDVGVVKEEHSTQATQCITSFDAHPFGRAQPPAPHLTKASTPGACFVRHLHQEDGGRLSEWRACRTTRHPQWALLPWRLSTARLSQGTSAPEALHNTPTSSTGSCPRGSSQRALLRVPWPWAHNSLCLALRSLLACACPWPAPDFCGTAGPFYAPKAHSHAKGASAAAGLRLCPRPCPTLSQGLLPEAPGCSPFWGGAA